ncbi:MAG TPA: hypothetical protein VIK55_07750 [Paludibacter sp.]
MTYLNEPSKWSFRDKMGVIMIILFGLLITLTILSIRVINSPDTTEKFKDIKDLFGMLLPLIGTWVGTVLAYYFSKDNFEAASKTDEVKQRYDELSRVFNPKNNKEPNEMMNTVNAEYDKLMMVLGDSKPIEAVKENVPLSDKLMELMGKVDTSELSLEVCGSWLWVTKKTFPIKDLLKSLGFRYSANKMAWY